jgi:hypothetical protein
MVMSTTTSPRLAEILKRENFTLRDDLQQDKRATLLAIVQMFNDFGVPYVITGGLAVQLYDINVRPTMDVDVVSLRRPFEQLLKSEQPWSRYGLELVFDHRRHIKLRHAASNVDVDINVDTRFARLLESPTVEMVEGHPIAFCAPAYLALAKLRTQRSDWPRDPVKRVQDLRDLMSLLRSHPQIIDTLRADPLTTDEMRQILEKVIAELARGQTDDLPPDPADDTE